VEKIRRLKRQKRIAGVCGGLAQAIGIDAAYMRLAWLAMALVPPFPHLLVIALYVGLAVMIPQEDAPGRVAETADKALDLAGQAAGFAWEGIKSALAKLRSLVHA
jgi:phage shock protein PspC (stress-responsive transcriptional regulator)